MTLTATAAEAAGKGKRFSVLVGALLIQLVLGTVYGYSIFWEPLTSNIFPPVITVAEQARLIEAGTIDQAALVVADQSAVTVEIAKQQGILKYAFSICILSFAAVMVIAGRFQDIQGPRVPAIIGGILIGTGFIYAGLMTNAIVFYLAHALFAGLITILLLMIFHAFFGHLGEESVIIRYAPMGIITTCIVAGVLLGNQYVGKLGEIDKLLLLWGTIGFMAGAGIGFAYVCPIAALMKWFPEHKGLVSGIAVAGFGLGAYLFSQKWGALGYISKQGIFPFFIAHGVVCMVVITAGALLLSNPSSPAPRKNAPVLMDSTWQETLRDPAFYLLWWMFFSGALAGLMVIGIIKVFAGEQLVAAAAEAGRILSGQEKNVLMLKGAAAVGMLAIFNAVGRVVWGFISDRIGRTPTFVALFLFQGLVMFFLAGMKTETMLSIGAALVGFNFGGNFALFPSATADLFGAKNLGANYGWVFTSYGIAGVVGIAAGNFAKVLTDSYAAAFTLAAFLCLLSAGLALVLQSILKKRSRQAERVPV